jgi:hypothetical protein
MLLAADGLQASCCGSKLALMLILLAERIGLMLDSRAVCLVH